MKVVKFSTLALVWLVLVGCNSEKHSFPTDKKYWTLDDYDLAVRELRFAYEPDEKLPTFDNANDRIIVEKLTDHENFKVILDDDELGISHRNNLAQKFFNKWKEMQKIYRARDRKDQYLYENEMLAVWQFGLNLQLRYFELGNQEIVKNADDPNASEVKRVVNSNIKTLIQNYQLYLDEINTEESYTTGGQKKLAQGIDKYFTDLIEQYPEAEYKALKRKAELLLNKSQSATIRQSLESLIGKL